MLGHVLSIRLMVGKSKAAVNPPRDKNSNVITQFTRLSSIVAFSSRAVRDHVVDRKRAKRTPTVKEVLGLDIAGNIFVSEFSPSKFTRFFVKQRQRLLRHITSLSGCGEAECVCAERVDSPLSILTLSLIFLNLSDSL